MRRLLIALALLAGPVIGAGQETRAQTFAQPLARTLPRALVRVADEQERARAAVRAGEIRSLQEILDRVRDRVAGRVLDAELEEAGRGRWTYRIKILTGDGRVVALAVDARTGEILRITGR